MKVTVLGSAGKPAGEVELPAVKASAVLLREYYEASRVNSRLASAHTKLRSDVSGGGKKPYKQKGTGRARQGSTRAPHWRHGGVVFGPRNDRVYDVELSRNKRRAGVVLMFRSLADDGRLTVVDALPQASRSKDAHTWLKGIGVTDEKRVYVLVDGADAEALRGFANLPGVTVMSSSRLDPKKLLASRRVVVGQAAIKALLAEAGKEAGHASV